MFRFDEFLEELSDAEQTVGSQRHTDDDDGRNIPSDHLVASAAAAAAAAATQSLRHHSQALPLSS